MLSTTSPSARARRHALAFVALALAACLPAAFAPAAGAAPVDPGRAYGWGLNNLAQLGNGTTLTPVSSPAPRFGDRRFKQVKAGESHTVALAEDGTVWTWGTGTFGKLGDGTTTGSDVPIKVPTLANVIAVDAGQDHSMALREDGTVWAWGDGIRGQLGNNSQTQATSPVQVLTQVVAIAAGVDTSMAVKRDGSLWLWGENSSGQLGLNPALVGNGFKSVPTQVPGFGIGATHGPVQGIDQGCGASYAVLENGALWGWGANGSGQVNPGGATTNDFAPGPVAGLPPVDDTVKQVTAGCGFAAVVTRGGFVYTWGEDDDGRLGTGNAVNQLPDQVPGLEEIDAADASKASMFARNSYGALYSWGDNFNGTAGNGGAPIDLTAPAPFTYPLGYGLFGEPLGRGVAGVGTGADAHHVFLIAQPAMTLSQRRIAFGTTSPVGGSTPLRTFSVVNDGADDLHVQSVKLKGADADQFQVTGDMCTGKPVRGGDSCTVSVRFAPVASGPAEAILTVDVQEAVDDTVLLSGFSAGFEPINAKSDPVIAWGGNARGEVGDLTQVNQDAPVPGPGQAVQLASGAQRSYALRSDGTVWGWGDNDLVGALGDCCLDLSLHPRRIEGINSVTAIAAGAKHAIALRSDGTVWGWGDGRLGQLADFNQVTFSLAAFQSPVPLPARYATDVVAIAAGENHNLAVRQNGEVLAWGENDSGELGSATPPVLHTPDEVPGLSNIVAVAAGSDHSLALDGQGRVWSWGSNADGQLGRLGGAAPALVPGAVDVVKIVAGENHSVALQGDGDLLTWGDDDNGQLGNAGGNNDAGTPQTLPFGAIDVAAGKNHTLFVDGNRIVGSVGDDASGQLGHGDGIVQDFDGPVTVALAANFGPRGGGPLGTGPASDHSLMIGRAHLTLDQAKLVFPSVAAGGVTPSQAIEVTNTGAAPLRIGKIDVIAQDNPVFDLNDADAYRITGDECSNSTLAVGETCRVGIRHLHQENITPIPVPGPVPEWASLRIPHDGWNGPEAFVVLDPPGAAAQGAEAAADAGEPAAAAAPASGPVRSGAAARRSIRVSCAKAKRGKRAVSLSCVLSGVAKGSSARAWLMRGRSVVASGRAKTGARGKAAFTLKRRRAVSRGLYTLAVETGGTRATARVAVR